MVCLGLVGTAVAETPVATVLAEFSAIDWNQRARTRVADPDDGAWRTRLAAVHRLIGMGEAAAPELRAALTSPNRHVRALAAFCLGALRDRAAREALIARLAADRDPTVRLYAAQALGRLGDPAALPALKAAGKDPANYVRDMSQLAQARLRENAPPGPSLREVLPPGTDFSTLSVPALGSLAPDFDLRNDQGERVKLAAYRGKKPVVIVFALANW